jgi:hypothetical protein
MKVPDADKSFFYFSGRSSNEAGFLTQLFARLYGTNNVNNCSYYCHQASGVGLSSVIGNSTATVQLEDVEQADLILVIGANPASNHPRFVRNLMNCRRRGGQVVVINPLRERGLNVSVTPAVYAASYLAVTSPPPISSRTSVAIMPCWPGLLKYSQNMAITTRILSNSTVKAGMPLLQACAPLTGRTSVPAAA